MPHSGQSNILGPVDHCWGEEMNYHIYVFEGWYRDGSKTNIIICTGLIIKIWEHHQQQYRHLSTSSSPMSSSSSSSSCRSIASEVRETAWTVRQLQILTQMQPTLNPCLHHHFHLFFILIFFNGIFNHINISFFLSIFILNNVIWYYQW